jgi:hypothetical protein
MFLDQKNIYCEDQAVTTSAASSTNIDVGAAGLDIGLGTPVWLLVLLTTPFDTSANTLTVELRHSATDGSYATGWVLLPARATSLLLTRGVLFSGPVPGGLKRYSQLYFTCSAALTSGTISGFFLNHGAYLAAQI